MKYRVSCWINPQSGKDLIKRAAVDKLLVASGYAFGNDRALEIMKKAANDHKGMIFKDFYIESEVENIKLLMSIIHKKHPEAELASWDTMRDT